jgi:hypothetical protein
VSYYDPESYAGGSLSSWQRHLSGIDRSKGRDETKKQSTRKGREDSLGVVKPNSQGQQTSKSNLGPPGRGFVIWLGHYVRPGKRKRMREFGLYSWNVRILYQFGSLRKMTDEMGKDKYKNSVNVLAVQEMRWTGTRIIDKGRHVILDIGYQKKHEFGVGFLVNNRMKGSITGFIPINHRQCVIRIAGLFFIYSIINAHVPVEDVDDEKMISIRQLLRPIKNVHNQIEKNEMGGACSTYGGKERRIQDFGGET